MISSRSASGGSGGSDGGGSSGGGGVSSSEEPAIPFPFEPYDVQKQLMSKIYATLEKGGIGIFESPTGTVSSREAKQHITTQR